jgi:uncharacterized BrkB/YihY/UPF0761 family membrane protein
LTLRLPRRPRLGLAITWFAGFWVAGVRPSIATLLAAWSVYWALAERPRLGLQWALFGAVLTAFFALLVVQTYT